MLILLIINLFFALVLVLTGIVCYRRPDLIAGNYNMSKEERQSDFVRGQAKYLRDILFTTAIIMTAGSIVAYFLHNELLITLFIILPPFLMAVFVLLKNPNKKRRNIYLAVFLTLMCLAILLFILYSGIR